MPQLNKSNLVFKDKGSKKLFYEERDKDIIKYDMSNLKLDDSSLRIRGGSPKNLKKGEYIVCIGAAQTFGCYCEKPFPLLLQKRLNFPVLNLGVGGAGPYYFLQNKQILKLINNAKFVIVQVMSARGESNSLFISDGCNHIVRRISDGKKVSSAAVYKELLKNKNHNIIKKIIKESRETFINNYIHLLNSISVHKILFWFSKRNPDYCEKYNKIHSIFGGFPQLVNLEMINKLKNHAEYYIECISDKGSPQPLINKITGKPTIQKIKKQYLGKELQLKYNEYYPSPEMHEDAANTLFPICKKYL